jgi:hypothetical protein
VLVEKDTHRLLMTVCAVSYIGRKRVHSREVLFLETGMLLQDLLLCHPVSQPAEDITHRDPHPANARFPSRLLASIVIRGCTAILA